MSKYTTEVRFICESYAGELESVGLSGVESVIERARGKVFDFAYPIFDEAYRGVLETKILRHFYTREIGAETVGLWKLWLNTRLNEIMPYYNKLYKSELLEFNPLYDFEVTRENKTTRTGTKEDNGERTEATTRSQIGSASGESQNVNKNNNYFSDTPQGGVGNLENLTYLTNASIDTGNETSTSSNSSNLSDTGSVSGTNKVNSVINDTVDYLETVKGKQSGASYAKLLEEYRSTFLNIDMKIINELSDLFMNIW